jgi:hypothetical protein
VRDQEADRDFAALDVVERKRFQKFGRERVHVVIVATEVLAGEGLDQAVERRRGAELFPLEDAPDDGSARSAWRIESAGKRSVRRTGRPGLATSTVTNDSVPDGCAPPSQ